VPENNGNGTGLRAVEFALPLHVYKKIGQNGDPDLYLIGVWEGADLKAICHLQPLETVMDTLRERLSSAGKKTQALQTT
jgi:hypothetical protein